MPDPAAAVRTVLCAVDRSQRAYAVTYAAAGVALHLDASLVMVRADPRLSQGKAEIRAARDDFDDTEHKCVSGPTGGRLRARLELTAGGGSAVIRQMIAEVNPLLLVLGTRQRSLLSRSLFGSTALSLMRETAVPLVVVPPSNPEVFTLSSTGVTSHMGRVLVPVDFSEGMDGQLRMASMFVRGTGTQVVLLNVARKAEFATQNRRLEEVRSKLAHTGTVELVVREGQIQDVLNDTLSDGDFGLVVLGRDPHRAGKVASSLLQVSTALVAISG